MNESYSKSKPLLRVRECVTLFPTQTERILKQGLLGYVLMDNVVEFVSKANKEVANEDPVTLFVRDYLLPWAVEHGIDVSSMKFKLNGATIMTCIQGMLLDDI